MTAADVLDPGSDSWLKLMTASKVAVVFGASPWESPYSLWHYMKGRLLRGDPTRTQERGHYLEPSVLAWWSDQHGGATLENQPVFYLDDWGAATPDAVSSVDGERVLVEAKTAARMDEWGAPGTDEIPTYYLLQVFWQMHVSGITRCFVPVLGPYLEFSEYIVDYDPAVGAQLEAGCRAFYDSLAGDEPPALDATVATYDAVRSLNDGIHDTEALVDLDIATEWITAKAALEAAETAHRAAKTRFLDAMADARKALVLVDNLPVTIARRQRNKTGVSLVALATPDQLTSPAAMATQNQE